MAHEVETMAFVGQTPWHGLGETATENEQWDWRKFCVKAGLNWSVRLRTLALTGTNDGVLVDHRAVVRDSDAKVLGVVGPRFCPLQNADAFGWFQPFLEGKEAALHTAGSLRGGSRVWVLAKLNRDPVEVTPGDTVEKYLLLSHGHDGSLAVRVGFTPIRVVCANTLAVAHGDKASKLLRLKHTLNLADNLRAVRDVVNVANAEFEATAEQYRALARKDINQGDLVRYVKVVLGVDKEPKLSGRSRNQIEEILRLAEEGRGNDVKGVRGTLWAAYNGVTEWTNHGRIADGMKRLDALWYGSGAETNKRALDVALEMAS